MRPVVTAEDYWFRCGARGESRGIPACGAPASAVRPFTDPRLDHFVCSSCQRPGDRPIRLDEPFRIVTVSVTLALAGVTSERALAQLEAADYLERVLEAAGVRLVLRRVHSFQARRGVQPAAGEEDGP